MQHAHMHTCSHTARTHAHILSTHAHMYTCTYTQHAHTHTAQTHTRTHTYMHTPAPTSGAQLGTEEWRSPLDAAVPGSLERCWAWAVCQESEILKLGPLFLLERGPVFLQASVDEPMLGHTAWTQPVQ